MRTLTLSSTQNKELSDTKLGRASVLISSNHTYELIFHEKGSWDSGLSPSLAFTNSFRWTLDREKGLISLEHLRYGIDKPVFLFHLTTNTPKILQSLDPHLCHQDSYLGNIQRTKKFIELNIRIIGPNKNETLSYIYQ